MYKTLFIISLSIFNLIFFPLKVGAATTCSIDNKSASPSPEYYGLHLGLETIPRDPAARRQLFQQIKQAGFHSIRTQLQWSIVERPIGTYNWQTFDEIFKDLESSGLSASLILIRIPKGVWQDDNKEILDPQQYFRWQNFVKAAVERYSYSVGTTAKIATQWEIWNEPELSYDGTPESLVELLNLAYPIIKITDPSAEVMAPATSTKGLNALFRGDPTTSTEFFKQIIQDGHFDVMNIHLYQKLDGTNGSLDYVNKVRQALLTEGNNLTRQAKLAVTETSENHWTCEALNSRTDAQQVKLITNRLACLANASVDYVYHYMAFDQPDSAQNDCPNSDYLRTGLFNSDLTPRKSYFAIQAMIKGETLVVFNRTDFANFQADFGKTGSPGWVKSDLNKDGVVDLTDYVIFVKHYRE